MITAQERNKVKQAIVEIVNTSPDLVYRAIGLASKLNQRGALNVHVDLHELIDELVDERKITCVEYRLTDGVRHHLLLPANAKIYEPPAMESSK